MPCRFLQAPSNTSALLLAVGLALPWAPVSHAQEDPSLRDRLSAVRSDRPGGVPRGTLVSIGYHLDVADRIEDKFPRKARVWRKRASRYLDSVEEGTDPYPQQKGKITNRGYRSPVSTITPGYAIYIPPDYDPSKKWPLYVALHGGSSNGNLFLGVVLGNNMDWETYKQHLWDEYEPKWEPDWIVVAPTGFGQVMWRWMGEKDVLDVIEDVKRHYNVNENQVVLGGLSNGGVGAYALGTRHAWKFSSVQAMAGAPSWIQYGHDRFRPAEERVVRRWSGLHLAENIVNTDFRYYHGRDDGGPMKPRFVREFTRHLKKHDLNAELTWYDTGHDVLYLVHKHGRIYEELAKVQRDPRPNKVRVVTGDYRANRQHWVTVTRIERYPQLARVRARAEGDTIHVKTEHARALQLHVRDAPVKAGKVRIVVDGTQAYEGPKDHLGHRVSLVRDGDRWRTGYPGVTTGQLEKKPGLSGPITDAYYGRMVHVYGTQDDDHTDALREAAERGSKGWPLWLWYVKQEVVADTEVTEELMESAHLVLYGTAGDNAVLERMREQLPIRLEDEAVVVGDTRHEGRGMGVRFIYPNPLAPDRYVIVQGGISTKAVKRGHRLPDFLPDYIVYDHRTTRGQMRLSTGGNRPVELGYFNDGWQLPGQATEGGDEESKDGGADRDTASGAGPSDPSPKHASTLPVPDAPERRAGRGFGAPRSDPAGRIARRIARRVRGFGSHRTEIAGASWTTDPEAAWSIRSEQECLQDLRERGVPARPRPSQPTPVPTPVEITGPVGDVWFRMMHDDRPMLLSCEMAARLPALARVLRKHGVHGVDVMSATRDHPRNSFHTMGLGLDLARMWTDDGWLSVKRHFQATPNHRTCQGPAPAERRARTLRGIACDLAQTRRFSSVLTPNYNEGHRDHFHLDARPRDARFFLR